MYLIRTRLSHKEGLCGPNTEGRKKFSVFSAAVNCATWSIYGPQARKCKSVGLRASCRGWRRGLEGFFIHALQTDKQQKVNHCLYFLLKCYKKHNCQLQSGCQTNKLWCFGLKGVSRTLFPGTCVKWWKTMWIGAPEASRAEAVSFYVCGPHFVGTSEASQGLLLGLSKKRLLRFIYRAEEQRGDAKNRDLKVAQRDIRSCGSSVLANTVVLWFQFLLTI